MHFLDFGSHLQLAHYDLLWQHSLMYYFKMKGKKPHKENVKKDNSYDKNNIQLMV